MSTDDYKELHDTVEFSDEFHSRVAEILGEQPPRFELVARWALGTSGFHIKPVNLSHYGVWLSRTDLARLRNAIDALLVKADEGSNDVTSTA